MESLPLIFDIHHFVLDDGPGIRTTVFLKGCPLSCAWCHNPEGLNKKEEIVFISNLCISCADCKSVCPNNAIDMDKETRIIRAKCNCCGQCAAECQAKALKIVGKYYPPDDLVEILLSDKSFYRRSSGGVTFSGGEPTQFMDYLSYIFRKLKENNIHIAIQTSGVFDFHKFKEKLLPFTDLVFFDLKLIDKIEYQRWVGGDVSISLQNFKHLCEQTGIRVIASVPLVPGITSTLENLTAIKNFINKSGCPELVLRPYHPGGIEKNNSLGKRGYDFLHGKPLSISEEQVAKQVFYREG